MSEKLGSRKTGTWLVAAICATLAMSASADDSRGTASLLRSPSFGGQAVSSATDLLITVAAPAPDQPAYVVGQFQMGGQFLDNPPRWFVPGDNEPGSGSLFIVLERALLTNDLTVELSLADTAGSSLYLDLLSSNCVTVGTNLYGNLIEGSNEVVCVELPLSLSEYPSASILRLWRGVGGILIYESQLTLTDKMEEEVRSDSQAPHPQSAHSFNDKPQASTPDGSGHPETLRTGHLPITLADLPDRTIYVDCKTGDDQNTGKFPTRRGNSANGPKKTVAAAMEVAKPGSTVSIAEGSYAENLNPPHGVTVTLSGYVSFH